MGIRRASYSSNKNTKPAIKQPITTHRELCFNLAAAKDTNFVEVPLGSVWLHDKTSAFGIADVVTIKPSYTRFLLDIYECKVSRQDFLSDLNRKKYEKYLPYCNRFYYACLKGVANKEEMPPNVGLIIMGDNGWSTVKAAKKRDVDIPTDAMLSLLFFKGRVHNQRRINIAYNGYYYGARTLRKKELKGLGKRVQEALLNYSDLELKFSNLLYEYTESLNVNDAERKKIREEWKKRTYIKK